jgi:hypothetical protein
MATNPHVLGSQTIESKHLRELTSSIMSVTLSQLVPFEIPSWSSSIKAASSSLLLVRAVTNRGVTEKTEAR